MRPGIAGESQPAYTGSAPPSIIGSDRPGESVSSELVSMTLGASDLSCFFSREGGGVYFYISLFRSLCLALLLLFSNLSVSFFLPLYLRFLLASNSIRLYLSLHYLYLYLPLLLALPPSLTQSPGGSPSLQITFI